MTNGMMGVGMAIGTCPTRLVFVVISLNDAVNIGPAGIGGSSVRDRHESGGLSMHPRDAERRVDDARVERLRERQRCPGC